MTASRSFHPRGSPRRARAIARALAREAPKYTQPVVGKRRVTGRDPFRILVAAVLSARTRDTATEVAARRLFACASTPARLAALPERTIRSLIRPVGMYPTKARWVRTIAQRLIADEHSRVPRMKTALLELPGVGPKVANLTLGLAFGIPAICVDTHVHRISNRLGLVRTRTREETERALERALPPDLWIRWNDLLVTWGQNVCVPVSPHCSRCVLHARRLCPRVGVRVSR